MPKSYRIRTSVGNSTQSDKSIKVQVDQDFDFLEILSLKLTQSDVYRSFCSDYGVVVGRVIANGGYGVPNAKVSVFVPIDLVDQNDPVISALYPYKNVSDKNEDGFRYNLLPYTPSYEGHAATGTFPTREDVLTRTEVLQIYEKYYKYTVKTNESGDYMIVGVPLGNQQVILDVDLSDMGCFSLRPTDLIRMNLGNPKQFDGNQFKSSSDLASLPQIVNQRKSISVSSFWGTGDVCDVGITRVDFDLRDSNITIEPTATFMGSIMTSNDSVMLKNNCKPSSEQGDLCGMVAGPGRILAVRQTINVDTDGDPILEQYQLEQGGKVIDENGAFVVDVPMNLDYVSTNEFGELIFSNNPSVGIPTKGKYRFKIKTDDGEKEVSAVQTSNSIIGPSLLNLSAFNPKGSLLRGNFLVPNIKEYGWIGNVDPATRSSETTIFSPIFGDNTKLIETRTFTYSDFGTGGKALLIKSITGEYKSITYKINNVVDNSKWVDLPNGNETLEITVEKKTTTEVVNGVVIETPQTITINFDNYDYNFSLFQRSYAFSLNWDDYPNKTSAISCQDFFYEFNYNKVYTTAQLIDEYRKGTNRSRFLSIKEILDRSCDSEVNKFPINDGVRNFDLLYFIISILFQIFGIVGGLFIIVYHIVKYLWNKLLPLLFTLLLTYAVSNIYWLSVDLANAFIKSTLTFGATLLDVAPTIGKIVLNGAFIAGITLLLIRKFKFPSFNLPMMTYPDCSTCDCNTTGDNNFAIDTLVNGDINSSPLADVTLSGVYVSFPEIDDDDEILRIKKNAGFGQVMAGNSVVETKNFARTPFYTNTLNEYFWSKNELPIPERINLYNTKGHYFETLPGGGSNRIKVYPNYIDNGGQISFTNAEFYEDQPMVFLVDANAITTFQTGNLITFVNLSQTYDVNILSASTVENGLNNYSVTGTTIPSGLTTPVTITYANPNGEGILTPTFSVKQTLYNGVASYTFPSDIEYHQVVTATTVGEIQNIVESKIKTNTPSTPTIDNLLFNSSFYKRIIDGQMTVYFDNVKDEKNKAQRGESNPPVKPLQLIENYKNLGVIILMKGVDPYTTRQKTKIDISKPFGLLEGSMVVESDYKLNIPIAPNLNLLRHDSLTDNNVSLFNQSYVFTPSTGNGTFKYSAYTTHNHSLYSNFDSDHDSNDTTVGVTSTNNSIGTQISGYYAAGSSVPSGAWAGPNTYVIGRNGYFANEYVEGGGLMTRRCKGFENPPINWCGAGSVTYSSNVYSTGITLNMSTSSKIIMRSDRLPRSSSFDERFVFSQNKAFSVFAISDNGVSTEIAGDVTSNSDYSTNDSVDFEESYGTGTTSVMSSFSCPTIVPLGAYTQSAGGGMTVKPKTDSVYYTGGDTDYPIITNGCYTLVAKDLAISADLKSFAEWKSRFLMGFAICRNVFGMTFTNNWINGVLYMPGFQNDKIYPGIEVTNPTYVYCREKIVFKEENNSFFYRSSPFNGNTGNFVGMLNSQVADNFGNVRFLGNPTTIVDLGPKDNIIKNVCAQPEFQGYVADRLKATSFQGVSDLMQYFIISRLTNADFLDRLLSLGDSSISELFSRPAQKIDGDFAQLNSINNEIGVIPFSPESYSEANLFYGASPKPVVGVFFSSDTVTRDYISPGREIFIDTSTKFGFNTFGHKTQVVPMYKWEIKQNGTNPSMFGGEENNWITSGTIYTTPYQGIDRLNDSTYFPSFVKHPTGQRPGYIYSSLESKDSSGNVTGFTYDGFFKLPNSRIVVGAPYHFYFGLKKGKTAFDIFLTKNLINI